MRNKLFFLVVMALVMVFVLSGCGQNSAAVEPDSSSGSAPEYKYEETGTYTRIWALNILGNETELNRSTTKWFWRLSRSSGEEVCVADPNENDALQNLDDLYDPTYSKATEYVDLITNSRSEYAPSVFWYHRTSIDDDYSLPIDKSLTAPTKCPNATVKVLYEFGINNGVSSKGYDLSVSLGANIANFTLTAPEGGEGRDTLSFVLPYQAMLVNPVTAIFCQTCDSTDVALPQAAEFSNPPATASNLEQVQYLIALLNNVMTETGSNPVASFDFYIRNTNRLETESELKRNLAYALDMNARFSGYKQAQGVAFAHLSDTTTMTASMSVSGGELSGSLFGIGILGAGFGMADVQQTPIIGQGNFLSVETSRLIGDVYLGPAQP